MDVYQDQMQHHIKLNSNIDPCGMPLLHYLHGVEVYNAGGADMISFKDALSKTLYW